MDHPGRPHLHQRADAVPGLNIEPSHVIPALIRKVTEARRTGRDHISVWGTGQASREFLFVGDAAEGIALAGERYNDPAPVNIGSGREITIRELAKLICELCGFQGEIRWDPSKPDGQPRRCLDVSRARELLGFQTEVGLEEGLERTIAWYEAQRQATRAAA